MEDYSVTHKQWKIIVLADYTHLLFCKLSKSSTTNYNYLDQYIKLLKSPK